MVVRMRNAHRGVYEKHRVSAASNLRRERGGGKGGEGRGGGRAGRGVKGSEITRYSVPRPPSPRH